MRWLPYALLAPVLLAQPAAPRISRDPAGTVTLSGEGVLRYTLDGSDPVATSGAYLAPILLPGGGVVKVRSFSPDRRTRGPLAEARFPPAAVSPPSTLVPLTQSRDWPKYDWEQRHAAVCAQVRERRPDLVFIGDSITHFFGGAPEDGLQAGAGAWRAFYGRRNALNLGFGWDRVENILWRLQHGEFDGMAPKVAVLLLGTNNRDLDPPEAIAAGIRQVCAEVRARSPRTRILLLGAFPRDRRPNPERRLTEALNRLLADFDGQDGITFLDPGRRFLRPDGTIPRTLMADYLHPTALGYQLWAAAMEDTLQRLLEEPDLLPQRNR